MFMCKICQWLKNRKTLYGNLPPKIIEELKPRDLVHLDLIGPYSKSIIQHQTGDALIKNNVSFTCMKMTDPETGWLEIIEITTYKLDKVKGGNDEYIYTSSSRVGQLSNNKWLSR